MQRYFSHIYWHFVGSPIGVDWHTVRKPADILSGGAKPKQLAECVGIAESILESRTLRATCTERISPQVVTRPFCCVTDIPLKDLPSHAPYYGKVALGFRANAIHASFLPVLYYPTRQLPQIQHGLAGAPVKRWLSNSEDRLVPLMQPDPALAANPFRDFLKITDFSVKPDESFYREREWRHPGSDFRFEPDDLVAVVAPQEVFERVWRFLGERMAGQARPSIVTWELIEDA